MPEELWFQRPKTLIPEVEQSVKNRAAIMSEWPRQIAEYHGKYYRGSKGKSSRGNRGGSPKNFAYSWNTRVIPEMAWYNPRVDVESIAPGVDEWERLLKKVALNQWIHDVDLARVLAQGPFLSAQWTAGYLMIAMAPITGMRPVDVPPLAGWMGMPKSKRQPMRPMPYYIPPSRCLEDPVATTREEIRFNGYDWKKSVEAIKEEQREFPDAGWNLELLDHLTTNEKGDDTLQAWGPREIETNRDEVFGRTIWVKDAPPINPANTPEKGYHGVLYVLPAEMDGDSDEWLRKPRDFFGPPSGPMHAFGVHSVPGYAAFLGPLTATQELADSLAKTASANSQSARNFKQIVLVNDKNPRLVQKMRAGKHHYVYGAKGFTSQDVAQIAMGGISDQNLVQEQREQEQLDDVSGLGELQRGHASGKATATENVRAEDNASVRFEWNERRMYDCTSEFLSAVAWYLERHTETLYPLSPESAAQLGYFPEEALDTDGTPLVDPSGKPIMRMETVWFRGGMKDSEEAEILASKIKIIPKSMSRRGNQRERDATMQFYTWLAQNLPLMRMHPEAGWPDITNDISEALGLPKLANRIDWELVEEFAKQQYGMQIQMMSTEFERAPGFASQVGQGGAQVFGGGGWGRGNQGPTMPGQNGAAGLTPPPFQQAGISGGGAGLSGPPQGGGGPLKLGATG